ncbi:hypothetical protein P9112_009038 [Eukaryota sp. TZLM1-RC]
MYPYAASISLTKPLQPPPLHSTPSIHGSQSNTAFFEEPTLLSSGVTIDSKSRNQRWSLAGQYFKDKALDRLVQKSKPLVKSPQHVVALTLLSPRFRKSDAYIFSNLENTKNYQQLHLLEKHSIPKSTDSLPPTISGLFPSKIMEFLDNLPPPQRIDSNRPPGYLSLIPPFNPEPFKQRGLDTEFFELLYSIVVSTFCSAVVIIVQPDKPIFLHQIHLYLSNNQISLNSPVAEVVDERDLRRLQPFFTHLRTLREKAFRSAAHEQVSIGKFGEFIMQSFSASSSPPAKRRRLRLGEQPKADPNWSNRLSVQHLEGIDFYPNPNLSFQILKSIDIFPDSESESELDLNK